MILLSLEKLMRNDLISNTNFVYEMKTLIQKVIFCFENDTYLTD